MANLISKMVHSPDLLNKSLRCCMVLPFLSKPLHPARRSEGSRWQRCTQPHAKSKDADWVAPWSITFDIRERETEWTPVNQARLVKMFAQEKLDVDAYEIEQRVARLSLLLPQIGSRLAKMKPDLLASLLRDPSLIAARLALLRKKLPVINVSQFAVNAPHVLLWDPKTVVREMDLVADLLKVDFATAQQIVSDHPRFLDAELVWEVLEELRRLMPRCDASMVLRSEPTWLLRVERGTKRLGCHPDDI